MFSGDSVWKVAFVRATVGALIAGALGFFGVWTQTDDIKTLVTAFALPALGVYATRLGLEGAVDSKK